MPGLTLGGVLTELTCHPDYDPDEDDLQDDDDWDDDEDFDDSEDE